ncbi:efflux RND transporter permease subunit [Bradyrhizobium sp. AUGA SZCCT0240]|uniref:efflux RND transporter permease subunit n=1 Tax=unclassified Bradyrhizobium TaxID=2631580 RepID=UPI001BAABA29|nr:MULTISPECIES: efflux RND transporter permease subunit [unclassified Bradyrhizobium]MBR1200977.1 efflux RND transporter permease subunit [Bradyrhizobium sp. AUGA SZCCT0158]MBR1245056.1 efflux RND transporter permease subunit [Bradyrhizobium sp. AUGA SZCCT0274]MBR1251214.1 efflux RND transporter permease subunit [Bradyrhizobium sp. AUGA SZCCT0169]MBR1258842.1 efflux RND transporter permease subunit [Bradyrhizobium sp. AUGA SZCCT0240]
MALNISAWSIRNPLPSIVFSIILLVLGWVSFTKLAVTRLPSADIPVISVAVSQFGAAPSELESQVTKTIEDGVSGVEGVRHISSSITDGLSLTTIQFALETNTDRALNDIKDAVTRVRASLPQNVTEPLIQRVDVIGLPIVTYAAISPGKTPEQLSYFVDDVVKRALQGVRGVAQVERIGGVEREILVSLDPDRLQASGLTAVNVSQILRGTNVDLAGGRAGIGNNDQAIRTLAGAKTLNELAGTMIPLFGGGEVRLDDLGTVTDTIADRRTFARFNGEPVVALGIKRSKGASDVVVAAAVQKRIDALKAAYPDVDLKMIDTSVDFTKGNYEAAISTLFEGAILAVIVVLLFLRDIRATIIAAISLPLSIFPAFWVMDLLGFSLNLVSFLAITLSTGILVDDAIVEIENIVRHMRMGKTPYRAALEAADEIGLAVIAISLTIIAIFAPASFMSGIAGQFFKQFGITVSVQVFFSLLAARFVTPVLAAYFLKDHPHEDPPPGRLLKGYTRLVTWSVKHYFITVLAGLAIFAASIWSITLLPQGFLPAQDTARSLLAMELPPGSQLAYTEKVTEEIVQRLRKRPEIKSIFVDGGRVPPGTQEVRRAALIINYTPKKDRDSKHTQRLLELDISKELENVPDIRFWFLDENGLRAISLVVTGIDSNIVGNVANELATQMKRIPIIANVISETSLDRPELRIRPRAELAARLGVSTESLSQTIRVATIGDVGPALAKFDAGDRQVPIRVQLEDSARGDLQMLQQLRVPLGQRGERGGVPLSVVADIQLDQGPTSINRYDRERQATVAADLVGTAALGDATKMIYDLPVMKSLPKGVKVSPSGDAESLAELSDGFATAITAGLMMVYAVLVLLFGTFLQPITILFSLPLSIGGAIAALLLTGKQLTTPVWIGILMLMGIVTKNAIMLVEFAVESIREGNKRDFAIIDAGIKRARPIIMTTIAMAAGMMPSALAFGAGGEFRSPMALAVIGGLIFSTLLSLVFVPAMFMMMDDLGALAWRYGKLLLASEAESDDVPPGGHHTAPPPAKGPPPVPPVMSPAAK